jgi:hypothetical protein
LVSEVTIPGKTEVLVGWWTQPTNYIRTVLGNQWWKEVASWTPLCFLDRLYMETSIPTQPQSLGYCCRSLLVTNVGAGVLSLLQQSMCCILLPPSHLSGNEEEHILAPSYFFGLWNSDQQSNTVSSVSVGHGIWIYDLSFFLSTTTQPLAIVPHGASPQLLVCVALPGTCWS